MFGFWGSWIQGFQDFRTWCLSDLEFGISGFDNFRVSWFQRFRVSGVQGLRFQGVGLGFGASGLEFSVWGFGCLGLGV